MQRLNDFIHLYTFRWPQLKIIAVAPGPRSGGRRLKGHRGAVIAAGNRQLPYELRPVWVRARGFDIGAPIAGDPAFPDGRAASKDITREAVPSWRKSGDGLRKSSPHSRN
jgi:hypothetical protein